jgi:tRNA A37 threonylcarbamoyladenosine modification protein TsaB
LAIALSIPLIAVPTLDIVAAAQSAFKGQLVAVVQAGRGRVCAGSYTWKKEGWVSSGEPEIAAWDRLIVGLDPDTEWLIAGEVDDSAWALIAVSRKSLQIASPSVSMRRAGVLADLA